MTKKILTSAQAAALTQREAIELVFLPGFSTREEVSDLSGRGVGMDVVKRKVEALVRLVTTLLVAALSMKSTPLERFARPRPAALKFTPVMFNVDLPVSLKVSLS